MEKFLRKVDARLRARLISAMADIALDRLGRLDIKPLQGHAGAYRCRVGNVRILFGAIRDR